jgi:hypothetical protein
MTTLFTVCAVAGGTVMIMQLLLTVLGFGTDHELGGVDHDLAGAGVGHDFSGAGAGDTDAVDVAGHHDSSWFFGVLSFRSLIAAIAFFGVSGMVAQEMNLPPVLSLMLALIPGVAALFLVAYVMRLLVSLRDEGNVNILNALGQPAKVYLTIPGQRGGKGKVTVVLQDRSMEFEAVTSEDTLLTGSDAMVVQVLEPDVLEVVRSEG